MAQKRNRSTNWDEEEKQILRFILKDYISVIEDKCMRTSTRKAKINAWSKVHKKFNELNFRTRDLTQLQIQWKVMKINARKHLAATKRDILKTGGGSKPASPSQEEIEVIDLLNPALDRDENKFDSDGLSMNIQFIELADSSKIINKSKTESLEEETDIFSSHGKSTQMTQSPVFNKEQDFEDVLAHSKQLKDAEHERRMEMAEEEHAIEMDIKRERLKCARLEHQILQYKLKAIQYEINIKP